MSLYRYAYTYDPAGNRTQMVRFDGTTTVTTWHSYNAGNQLTARYQDDGPEWDYVYDANGNQVWELDAAVGQTGWWRGHNARLLGPAAQDYTRDIVLGCL